MATTRGESSKRQQARSVEVIRLRLLVEADRCDQPRERAHRLPIRCVVESDSEDRPQIHDDLRLSTVYATTTYEYDARGNLGSVSQSGQSRSFQYDLLSRQTSATNPESGQISYQYDAASNLTQRQIPDSRELWLRLAESSQKPELRRHARDTVGHLCLRHGAKRNRAAGIGDDDWRFNIHIHQLRRARETY